MKKHNFPRLSFGIIVLNGEPFISYNLRTLYPFAHELIIVEGAVPAAANIATPDGHSRDNTLKVLEYFKKYEDTEGKLIVVTAEDEGYPNGFWPGEKDEQSQAYARRATGDYLWQVDIDEFYKPEDMQAVLDILRNDPKITAISFKMVTFWGGFDYITDGWYLRQGAEIYHRLFKWGPGYRYVTHRPPTVHDPYNRNLRGIKWLGGYELARRGILLYHYSLLFPQQVIEKCEYYGMVSWAHRAKAQQWAEESFLQLRNPYRVHNVYDHPSWLERFVGKHPPQIEVLRADLESSQLSVTIRPTDDIECLLTSPIYVIGRWGLKVLFVVWVLWQWFKRIGRKVLSIVK